MSASANGLSPQLEIAFAGQVRVFSGLQTIISPFSVTFVLTR
jgi:hypothetical protein